EGCERVVRERPLLLLRRPVRALVTREPRPLVPPLPIAEAAAVLAGPAVRALRPLRPGLLALRAGGRGLGARRRGALRRPRLGAGLRPRLRTAPVLRLLLLLGSALAVGTRDVDDGREQLGR